MIGSLVSLTTDWLTHILYMHAYDDLEISIRVIACSCGNQTIVHQRTRCPHMIIYVYNNVTMIPIFSPNLLRVDSYYPHNHLIDITLEIKGDDYNRTDMEPRFITKLRNLTTPWFPKVESTTLATDK